MGKTLLAGKGEDSFPLTLDGLEPLSSLEENALPQTVLIGENDGPRGKRILEECVSHGIPFVVLGRGWPRDVPAAVRNLAKKTGSRIIGPGSGGLVTPFLSGDGRSKTALLAEGRDLFQRTVCESHERSVPMRYAFSFGEKSDLSPVEAARAILELDGEVRFFVFLLERLRKGRDLLEFAAEAAVAGNASVCWSMILFPEKTGSGSPPSGSSVSSPFTNPPRWLMEQRLFLPAA
jgi:hypothetical protein